MVASEVLRYARSKASLSQRELGARAGVTQASIARIEQGRISPRFETLDRLLDACGFELEVVPRRGVGIDRTGIRDLLQLSPQARAEVATAEARNLDRIRPTRRR
jgi:transcriptional regulator with XRE-family HTH domain